MILYNFVDKIIFYVDDIIEYIKIPLDLHIAYLNRETILGKSVDLKLFMKFVIFVLYTNNK